MTPIMPGVAAAVVTVCGGMVALRFGRRLWLLMSVAAGVVLGVAIFDLLPEAIALAQPASGVRSVTIALAAGFGAYLLLDDGIASMARTPGHWRRHLAPATLTLHSVVDGLGIGLAFQVDARTGWLVALGVVTHDFADGVNTVGVCLAAQARSSARRWLGVNSVAPIGGVLIGQWLRIAPTTLALLVAVFAGAFLYIGACELLPRSRAQTVGFRNTVATLAGVMLMALATGLHR